MFSLNFSSAGKGPFVDGKAKNIYFSKRGGGGGHPDPEIRGGGLRASVWSKNKGGADSRAVLLDLLL